MCRDFAKQHLDDPDVPAAPDGATGYAEWVQIALILCCVKLEKNLRETEAYLNDSARDLASVEFPPDGPESLSVRTGVVIREAVTKN